jgi:hypothetical protein
MAGETEVLGENLPRRHFVHHKSQLTRPGIEPGPPRWEAVKSITMVVTVKIQINRYQINRTHELFVALLSNTRQYIIKMCLLSQITVPRAV